MESVVSELQFLFFGSPHPIPPSIIRESAPRKTIARDILDYLDDDIDFVCISDLARDLGISDQQAYNVTCPLIEVGKLVSERRRYRGERKLFVRMA